MDAVAPKNGIAGDAALVAKDIDEPSIDYWVIEKPSAKDNAGTFHASVEAAFVKNPVEPFVPVRATKKLPGKSVGKAFCEWMASLPALDRLGIGSTSASLAIAKTMWMSRAGCCKVKRTVVDPWKAGRRRVIPNLQKKCHTRLRDRLLVAESTWRG